MSPLTLTPTACSSFRPREVDGQGAEDHHHQRQVAPLPRGRAEDDGRRREVRGGGRRLQEQGRVEELARELLLLHEEHPRRREGQGQDLGGGQGQGQGGGRRRALVAGGQPDGREGGVRGQAQGG